MSSTMLQVVIFVALFGVACSMHCLVTRPGYGLVSEQCPAATVACRIRIDHNSVDFYQYSSLYDRNQFVCVLRNEYGDIKQSGCVEKRTGKIRCWCYGRSNCNTPEDSKKLYESFKSGNHELLRETIDEIDFPNLHNDEPSEFKMNTTTLKTTTERQIEKLGPQYASDSKASNDDVLKINNLPAEEKPKTHSHHHNKKHHHHHKTTTTTERPVKTTTEEIMKEHIYKSPIIKVSKERKAFIPVAANAANAPVSFSKPIVRPPAHQPSTTTQPPSTTEDSSNVKVIYVNSKDKYQNVIGSPEFRKALHLDEPDEAHLLPTENDKKKSYVNRNVDPFNTEYNESEDDALEEDDDPLADLPMTDQEADLYLNDETKIPRVRARSKDLDEYASSSAYYDSAIVNKATKILSTLTLFSFTVFLML